jgi:hypothetical protein
LPLQPLPLLKLLRTLALLLVPPLLLLQALPLVLLLTLPRLLLVPQLTLLKLLLKLQLRSNSSYSHLLHVNAADTKNPQDSVFAGFFVS